MKITRVSKTIMHCFIVGAITFASSAVFANNFYKWTDSKGTTHYTKTPPPKNAKQRGTVETYGYQSSNSTPSAQQPPQNNTNVVEPTTNTATTPETTESTLQPAESEAPSLSNTKAK